MSSPLRTKSISIVLATALMVVLTFSCENSSNETTVESIALTGVGIFSPVSGTVEIGVRVEGAPSAVDLLVDGVVVATSETPPLSLTWDTTTMDDGVVRLAARTDEATSDEIPVVILNNGVELDFFRGSRYELAIDEDWKLNPDDPGEGRDFSNNWLPSTTVTRALAVTWFESTGLEWEIELAVGRGTCPHGGEQFDAATKKISDFMWIDSAVESYRANAEHFAHIRVINAEERRGDVLKGQMRLFVF